MSSALNQQTTGVRLRVRGLVQGVGFRPTVWRMALEFKLSGQVMNIGDEVMIEIWGDQSKQDDFAEALFTQCPPLARIDSVLKTPLTGSPAEQFEIINSQENKSRTFVTPDAATCPECVAEILSAENKRYRYPFTNCTNCGPRLTIIDRIPYDRKNTSMIEFEQCATCQAEYDNPRDRRFHAQPNACPDCGPEIYLTPPANDIHAEDDIQRTKLLLAAGKIVAIKGIGGFHLACDATNQAAVDQLRKRKKRVAKPFAIMAKDISEVLQYCEVSSQESELLSSTQAPIVLLKALNKHALADSVAPKQKLLGFMLPYTPLHHLLLENLDFPLVMTSGNISDDPQLIDNQQAKKDLANIADYWLLHNRPIRHRIDDSVVRVINKKPQVLRRARGYAPAPLPLPKGFNSQQQVLAFGAELKNTFCLIKDQQTILSQHIGDLKSAASFADYEKNLTLYQQLFQLKPTIAAVDKHPDYLSSKSGQSYAENNSTPLIKAQHHHAHLAACLADNQWPLTGEKVLGIILDGTGFGDDQTIWGGEFLYADYENYERLAHFKPTELIGATKAIQEPWRNTYAHLVRSIGWQNLFTSYAETDLVEFFKRKPYPTLNAMLEKNLNSPLSSSCGRLFDAVAAAIGICRDQISYEGQAAIELEALINEDILRREADQAYVFNINQQDKTPYIAPTGMWKALLHDLKAKKSAEVIACRFHHGLANIIVEMVEKLCHSHPKKKIKTIALSGGVFQNRILFELVTQQLNNKNYRVLSHQHVPANDGGLALGQALIALANTLKENQKCA